MKAAAKNLITLTEAAASRMRTIYAKRPIPQVRASKLRNSKCSNFHWKERDVWEQDIK